MTHSSPENASSAMTHYRDAWLSAVYDACGDYEKAKRAIELADLNGLFDPVKAIGIRAQSVPDPCAQFVMWALMEGSWQGCNIDGGAAQDKAVDLGLIVATEYDPEKHGESDCCDPGDTWYVPSPALLAALGDTSSSSPKCGDGA